MECEIKVNGISATVVRLKEESLHDFYKRCNEIFLAFALTPENENIKVITTGLKEEFFDNAIA